jgi:hypothetical protein
MIDDEISARFPESDKLAETFRAFARDVIAEYRFPTAEEIRAMRTKFILEKIERLYWHVRASHDEAP